MEHEILLVGCGKMGSAMLAGWLDSGTVSHAVVVDPSEANSAAFRDWSNVTILSDASELPEGWDPEVVVFAVKPQLMDQVVPAYAHLADSDTFFLSIAAGRKVAWFQEHLGEDALIVRAMPNTPAAVRAGISVCYTGAPLTPEQMELAEVLMGAVGDVSWVEREGLLDAVTAVSGSGPAYVFYMIEALARAGVAEGLPTELAQRLARQTVIGSGLLARQSGQAPEQLRENVTSPGGTTAAALDVLMNAEEGLQPVLNRTVSAAARRARELAE
ncbi:MAG: pyrroline-5-carboxylate reductase [Alphaproteobacteria bacterium]